MRKLVGAIALPLALVAAASAQAVTIDFEELPSGQTASPIAYPTATFTSSSGEFYINGASISQDLCPYTGSCSASLIVAFTGPVSNLSFTSAGDDDASAINWLLTTTGGTTSGSFFSDGNPGSKDFFSFGAISGMTGLQLTSLDGAGVTYDDFTFDVGAVDGAVPEPSTWAMMIVGFGLVGATMRRRARKLVFAF